MLINMIVAMTPERVIGNDNQLLWHLPADLRYFKAKTTGNIVLMGRKTYDSIGKPLPNRTNIVISRNATLQLEGVHVVASLEAGIALSKELMTDDQQLFVIGGAQIYKEAMPLATNLFVTEVEASYEGDAFFPEIPAEQWTEIERENHDADEKNKHNYSFVSLQKTTL
jgi:dihydrofolate reductase